MFIIIYTNLYIDLYWPCTASYISACVWSKWPRTASFTTSIILQPSQHTVASPMQPEISNPLY